MPQVVKKQYVSRNGEWVEVATGSGQYVSVAGDTMTGALTLPADPSAPLEAATKQYIDSLHPSCYVSFDGSQVIPSNSLTDLSGGSLTGDSVYSYDPASGIVSLPGLGSYSCSLRARYTGAQAAGVRSSGFIVGTNSVPGTVMAYQPMGETYVSVTGLFIFPSGAPSFYCQLINSAAGPALNGAPIFTITKVA